MGTRTPDLYRVKGQLTNTLNIIRLFNGDTTASQVSYFGTDANLLCVNATTVAQIFPTIPYVVYAYKEIRHYLRHISGCA